MADEQPTIATEHWKPIPGWEGYYEASDHGRIRSVDRVVVCRNAREKPMYSKILSPATAKCGHLSVVLCRNSVCKTHLAHRLIALTFLGECPDGMEVLHWDDVPSNNHVENLRYGTRSDNLRDAARNRKHWQSAKDLCPRGHVLNGSNLHPWHLHNKGHRVCLSCSRAHAYTRYHKNLKPEFQRIADSYYSDIMRDAA